MLLGSSYACSCAFHARRRLLVAGLGGGAAAALPSVPAWAREGVEVGNSSSMAQLVPAEKIESSAAVEYRQLLRQAASKKALAGPGNAQLARLRTIAQRMIPYTYEWNPRAREWKWEVNLIGSSQVNAFCMPGGKIAFFTGILDKLRLNDGEVAVIMGHEMAHALREHARARMGKSAATRGVIELGSAILGLGTAGRLAADMGQQLLTLKFGRDDESEADLIGMELAARSGYDPHSAVSLWEKMAAAEKGQSLEILSTHPSSPTRIEDLRRNLPKVEPLYARAQKPAGKDAD